MAKSDYTRLAQELENTILVEGDTDEDIWEFFGYHPDDIDTEEFNIQLETTDT